MHYRSWIMAASLVAAVSAQYTANSTMLPILNMCVRFNHQSTVKNNVLYVDGGLEGFVPIINGSQGYPLEMGYNTWLLEIPLTSSWDWTTNISETALNKTKVPNTGTLPPSLTNGALYQGSPDDSRIWIYGGTTSWWNTSAPGFWGPLSKSYSLWSYDTASGVWGQYDVTSAAPWRPSYGASAEAPNLGLTFYYGGQLDSGSSQETQFYGDNVKKFLSGMVVLNTTNPTAITALNISTTAIEHGQPRSRGALQYVPGIGSKGILVSFGGVYRWADDIDANVNANYMSMSEIDIFDVGSLYNTSSNSSGWYTQQATGDIPMPRGQFCAITVSAPDNSSHNIYIYGGVDEASNTYYDDVYVLSLPSFTWTMLYGEGSSPRFAHTCHLVGNRQMITVGGISNTNPQLPCDWESKGVGILDISTMTWGSVYDANAAPYQVPAKLVHVVGGDIDGKATNTVPSSGYNSSDLAVLFGAAAYTVSNRTNPTGTSTPTLAPIPKPTLSTGAIVGIAIGGAALLGLVGLGFILFSRRQKKQTQTHHEQDIPLKSTISQEDSDYNEWAGRQYGTQEMEVPHALHEAQDPRTTHEMSGSERFVPMAKNAGNPWELGGESRT